MSWSQRTALGACCPKTAAVVLSKSSIQVPFLTSALTFIGFPVYNSHEAFEKSRGSPVGVVVFKIIHALRVFFQMILLLFLIFFIMSAVDMHFRPDVQKTHRAWTMPIPLPPKCPNGVMKIPHLREGRACGG
ncbi:MAG: hypothetical protein D6765_11895 [Bacteroidetes bacterium]|nr:MAG: hypothetical protein D6765_11895 [Bacteroidota bacterium]